MPKYKSLKCLWNYYLKMFTFMRPWISSISASCKGHVDTRYMKGIAKFLRKTDLCCLWKTGIKLNWRWFCATDFGNHTKQLQDSIPFLTGTGMKTMKNFETQSFVTGCFLTIKITISSFVVGLKSSYFPLIHLPSYCWTVCYRIVITKVGQFMINKPITYKRVV